MFTQYLIEISAAVHELWGHGENKNSDRNITVRRYRADSKTLVYWLHDENQKALQNAITFKILKELTNSKADYNDEMNVWELQLQY